MLHLFHPLSPTLDLLPLGLRNYDTSCTIQTARRRAGICNGRLSTTLLQAVSSTRHPTNLIADHRRPPRWLRQAQTCSVLLAGLTTGPGRARTWQPPTTAHKYAPPSHLPIQQSAHTSTLRPGRLSRSTRPTTAPPPKKPATRSWRATEIATATFPAAIQPPTTLRSRIGWRPKDSSTGRANTRRGTGYPPAFCLTRSRNRTRLTIARS
jgi:hypothetical protein